MSYIIFLSATEASTVLPYIDLGTTDTQYVPVAVDGISAPINVEFPLGCQILPTIYVCFHCTTMLSRLDYSVFYNR